MTQASFHSDDTGAQHDAGPAPGRGLAVALSAGIALALLAGGVLLWRDRAELVFLDMVASALAMCF